MKPIKPIYISATGAVAGFRSLRSGVANSDVILAKAAKPFVKQQEALSWRLAGHDRTPNMELKGALIIPSSTAE